MSRSTIDQTARLTKAYAALAAKGGDVTVRALTAEARVATEAARRFLAGLRADEATPELSDSDLAAATRPLIAALVTLIREAETEARIAERAPLIDRAEAAELERDGVLEQLAATTARAEALAVRVADLEATQQRMEADLAAGAEARVAAEERAAADATRAAEAERAQAQAEAAQAAAEATAMTLRDTTRAAETRAESLEHRASEAEQLAADATARAATAEAQTRAAEQLAADATARAATAEAETRTAHSATRDAEARALAAEQLASDARAHQARAEATADTLRAVLDRAGRAPEETPTRRGSTQRKKKPTGEGA